MDINQEIYNVYEVIINGGIIYYPTDIFGYVIPFFYFNNIFDKL